MATLMPALRHLLLFARYPVPGSSKTRLIPAVGAEAAAELHRAMTVHTVMTARRFALRHGAVLEVYYAGGTTSAMSDWLGPDLAYYEQQGEDLGARMLSSVQRAYQDGARRIVLIGTDSPELAALHLSAAFEALEKRDVVIGPARDGGYYLLGLHEPHRELFEDIPWGTDEVYAKTLEACMRVNRSVFSLPLLDDIDRAEDLPVWERFVAARSPSVPLLSVIIPTLNEAPHIANTLSFLANDPRAECIVADGGSDDGTVALAHTYGATVVDAPRGRARQFNAGASVAQGDALFFLHADTIPPEDYVKHCEEILSCPNVAAGAFRFRLDASSLTLRLIELGTNLRAGLFQRPYGDQGLFLRREMFVAADGYPDLPIMEDYELLRRLRRLGRIVIAPADAVTSSRRWERVGALRLTLLHWAIVVGYWLGVPPERLVNWRRHR